MPLQYNFQQQNKVWAIRIEPEHQGEGERQFTWRSKRHLRRRPKFKAKARGWIQFAPAKTFANTSKAKWGIWKNGERLIGSSIKDLLVQAIYWRGRIENEPAAARGK